MLAVDHDKIQRAAPKRAPEARRGHRRDHAAEDVTALAQRCFELYRIHRRALSSVPGASRSGSPALRGGDRRIACCDPSGSAGRGQRPIARALEVLQERDGRSGAPGGKARMTVAGLRRVDMREARSVCRDFSEPDSKPRGSAKRAATMPASVWSEGQHRPCAGPKPNPTRLLSGRRLTIRILWSHRLGSHSAQAY